jgi:outer membrane protein assembly factor BamB
VVTYAAPLGWGADKGTIVVQHVLADGSSIYSFYGHLDPPSVVLSIGDCVARGERVGRIGRPRSPPHLHFEIRLHTASAPGPGYWPDDPTLAGWVPPSQTIWAYRIAASPGVQWMRPFAGRGMRGVGMLDHDTFVAIEDEQLVGISVQDGSLRWSQTSSVRAKNAMIAADWSTLYAVDRHNGRVEAFGITDTPRGSATAIHDSPLVPVWDIRLGAAGSATLMPLPGGGVVAAFRQKMFGVSAAGELLWKHNTTAQVLDWVLWGDRVIFSAIEDGSLWTADEAGPMAWMAPTSGYLVVVDDKILMYGENGVYRLNPETLSVDLLYALPKGFIERGRMVTLSDGGLLLTHADAFDRRLIALNADGTLRWQRSYARTVQGYEHDLLVLDGRPYLVSYHRVAASSEVSVFAIDVNRARLVRIFVGAGRIVRPEYRGVCAIGDGILLLSVGSGVESGSIIAIDTQLALEAVLQAMNTQ